MDEPSPCRRHPDKLEEASAMNDTRPTLSASAQSIQDVLSSKGIEARVVELSSSTRTAEDAARAIGCQVAQIVKSLVFRTKDTGRPILVLASGANRVNEKLLAKVVGEKIDKADAEFTRDVTGFAIGGIPPVGHKQRIDTLIDGDLMTHPILWAAAGTPHAVFSLSSIALHQLTGGTIVSVK
jgi:prolyl-tRNA editing enzyme YbaK/EbsC (Cys-tRNA(Pro) deacylase)